MAQRFLILGDNLESLSDEINRLENALALIRASGTSHSILSLESLRTILDKIRTLYNKEQVLDIEYRDYYEIIKLGYFYIDNQIVIVYKVPIALSFSYDFYKLSIVPNKFNLTLIPTSPYMAIHSTDSRYMEAECPKASSWFLCEGKSHHQDEGHPDCIHQLITKQHLDVSCKMTKIILTRAALEELDEMHYTITLPESTRIKISCGQEQYKNLQGSFLAIIPRGCSLSTPEFTVFNANNKIKGRVLKILELPSMIEDWENEENAIQLNTVNLENLHRANTKISMQQPVKINQVKDYTLYHTTIPIYIILSSASALGIGLLYRHLRGKGSKAPHPDVTSSSTPKDIYSEVTEDKKVCPRQIRIDPCNISATLGHL